MLFEDLRYAFRRLRQSPGYAAVCVLTLALGLGANTAIFTLVDAVMLKSLPVKDPGELYRAGSGDNCCGIGGFQDNWGIYSYPLYAQFRDHTPEFSELAVFQGGVSELSVRRSGSGAAADHLPVSSFPAITFPLSGWGRSPDGPSMRPTTGPQRRPSRC